MRKINCAVIGCGRIGCGFDDTNFEIKVNTHAGSYYQNRNTDLVALCDIDYSKLLKYGKKYQISKLYRKSKDMFRAENLDCVSICTLASTHLDLVKQAADAGIIGIFLEKPISTSLENARKIINICRRNNVKLIIDHQRRFHPFYHSIKLLLDKNKIGKIQLVNLYYGAGVANTGSHIFDLLRFFLGEAKSVKGKKSNNKSQNTSDPNIDVEIEFKNKIICRIQALDVRNYGMLEMDLFGVNGRLRLNLVSNKAELFRKSKRSSLVYKELQKSNFKPKQTNQTAIMHGVENLVDCVRNNAAPLCGGEDGYKSLELTIASIMSSRKKKKILLPLKNKKLGISSR